MLFGSWKHGWWLTDAVGSMVGGWQLKAWMVAGNGRVLRRGLTPVHLGDEPVRDTSAEW